MKNNKEEKTKMTDNQDLDTLCEQAQVDSNKYRPQIEKKLIEQGFLQLESPWSKYNPSYFKLNDGDISTYVFLEGVTQSKKFRGTYVLNLLSTEAEHFENLIYEALSPLGSLKPVLLGGAVGCVVSGVLGGGLVGGGIGGAGLGWFYSLYSGGKISEHALKELEKTYLPKSDHSDKAFDYEVIRKVLETEGQEK